MIRFWLRIWWNLLKMGRNYLSTKMFVKFVILKGSDPYRVPPWVFGHVSKINRRLNQKTLFWRENLHEENYEKIMTKVFNVRQIGTLKVFLVINLFSAVCSDFISENGKRKRLSFLIIKNDFRIISQMEKLFF